MNLREWLIVKWSFLSHESHLAQTDELHINHVDSLSQEVKALKANEANQPSDTLAIAKLDGWDSKLNGE